MTKVEVAPRVKEDFARILLLIGRDSRGYLALYAYDSFADRVLVLAIRSQREAGHVDSSSTNMG